MIGAILGGTERTRLGLCLGEGRMAALAGRRVVFLSALESVPLLDDERPVILAPDHEGSRPVDVVAECLACEGSADRGARFFADGCLFAEGAEKSHNSNDRFWTDNLRVGLETFFSISLALRGPATEPLARGLCDCARETERLAAHTEYQKPPQAPSWLKDVPADVAGRFRSTFLARSSTVGLHFSTLNPTLADLEKTAPDDWTVPFLGDEKRETIFIHSPDWGNATLYVLLNCLLRGGASFVLPEVDRWTSREQERIGHFLLQERGCLDLLWTADSAPAGKAFHCDGIDWVCFAKTTSAANGVFFGNLLTRCGVGREGRLKELDYETPQELADGKGLLYREGRWVLPDLEETAGDPPLMELVRKGQGVSFEDRFLAGLGWDLSWLAIRGEGNSKERMGRRWNGQWDRIETVRAVPEFVEERPRSGLCSYRLEGRPFEIRGEAGLAARPHKGLFAVDSRRRTHLLALYECLWPDRGVSVGGEPPPSVRTHIPVRLQKGRAKADGILEALVPTTGRTVELHLATPNPPRFDGDDELTAFGFWQDYPNRFFVEEILRPRLEALVEEPFGFEEQRQPQASDLRAVTGAARAASRERELSLDLIRRVCEERTLEGLEKKLDDLDRAREARRTAMAELVQSSGENQPWTTLIRLQDGLDEGPLLPRDYRDEADRRGLGPDFLEACHTLHGMRLIGIASSRLLPRDKTS